MELLGGHLGEDYFELAVCIHLTRESVHVLQVISLWKIRLAVFVRKNIAHRITNIMVCQIRMKNNRFEISLIADWYRHMQLVQQLHTLVEALLVCQILAFVLYRILSPCSRVVPCQPFTNLFCKCVFHLRCSPS